MQKKLQAIKTRDVLIVFGFLAAMMVVGSIWDYPISQALYNQANPFGIFFAAYGELPAMLGLIAGGTMLIIGRNKEKKLIAIIQILCGIFVLFLGAAMLLLMPNNYLKTNIIIPIIIGLLVMVAVIFLVVKLCKGTDRSMIIRVAAIFILVVIAEMVLVNIVKIPWGRPRMRLMAEFPDVPFVPWWIVGGFSKDALIASGVSSDQFKSFPSGHTANGAAMVLLCLLPLLSEKLKGKQSLLFFVGAFWGVLVALSRIIMGAHFLTDTMVGFIISLLTSLVLTRLFLGSKFLSSQKSLT